MIHACSVSEIIIFPPHWSLRPSTNRCLQRSPFCPFRLPLCPHPLICSFKIQRRLLEAFFSKPNNALGWKFAKTVRVTTSMISMHIPNSLDSNQNTSMDYLYRSDYNPNSVLDTKPTIYLCTFASFPLGNGGVRVAICFGRLSIWIQFLHTVLQSSWHTTRAGYFCQTRTTPWIFAFPMALVSHEPPFSCQV